VFDIIKRLIVFVKDIDDSYLQFYINEVSKTSLEERDSLS